MDSTYLYEIQKQYGLSNNAIQFILDLLDANFIRQTEIIEFSFNPVSICFKIVSTNNSIYIPVVWLKSIN